MSLSRRSLLVSGASLGAMSAWSHNAKALMFIGPAGVSDGFNVKNYGAAGNGVMISDVSMTSGSPTLTSAGSSFTSALIGRSICVANAGASNVPLVTTISAAPSGTTLTLAANAGATVSSAVAHYGTDDTVGVQAAITAAYNAGGGVVGVPHGIYFIGGAFFDPTTYNSQLYIPAISPSTGNPISIAIIGETAPIDNDGCCAGGPPPATGSILYSPRLGTAPSGVLPSLITPLGAGSSSNFSKMRLTIGNLILRSAHFNSSRISMVNARFTTWFTAENLSVDTDATLAQLQATMPPGGIGVIMPSLDNGALSSMRNCDIRGYQWGVEWGEHGDLDNTFVEYCQVGYAVPGFNGAYHALRGGRIGAYRTIHPISVQGGGGSPGKIPLQIQQLAIEHETSGWYTAGSDIDDPGNVLYGNLTYNIVTGFVGQDNASFSKNGGTHLTCTALF